MNSSKMINKVNFKRRAIVATLLLVVVMLVFVGWKVFAAANPPSYGKQFYPYTRETSVRLTGDLTPSGPNRPDLEFATRDSHALWSDIRFRDLSTKAWSEATAGGEYKGVITFNIIEEEAQDDFNKREGYNLIPLNDNESSYGPIKLVAEWANGNPDYIINKLKEGSDESNYYLRSSNRYFVGVALPENTWYRLPSLIALSGGGLNMATDMVAQTPTTSKNRGVTFPSFKTTYSTTPWPKVFTIYGAEGKDKRQLVSSSKGNLRISTQTSSYWGNKHKLWFVEGKFSQEQIMAEINKTTAASGKRDATRFDSFTKNVYKEISTGGKQTFSYNTSIPVTDIKKITKADGTVRDYTLVVSDGYDRIAVQNFKLGVSDPDLAVDPNSISITPAAPQPAGSTASVSIDVLNNGTNDIASTYLLWRWNSTTAVQKVPIANFKAGERRKLKIEVKYPNHPDVLIFNINGYKDNPPNESDWENNRAQYKVGTGSVNLRATEIRVTPSKPQPGQIARFQVLVENESYTETITNTYLDWSVNGVAKERISSITLAPREKKWITDLKVTSVPQGDKLTIKAEINSGHNRPSTEYRDGGLDPWVDNKIEKVYDLKEKTLNLFVKSVSSGTATQSQNVTTRVEVGRENLPGDPMEAKTFAVKLFLVDASGKDTLVGTQQVTFSKPGENKTLMMSWNTGGRDLGNYNLVATINLPPSQGEKTYQDNQLSAGFTIYGRATNGTCKVTNHTSDISGTYEYCARYGTGYDSNGNSYSYCARYETGYYYEYFNSNFNKALSGTFVQENADEINGTDVPLVRSNSTTIKAGQGFNFVIDSKYTEDRGRTGNIYRAVAHFPKADGTIEDIELVKLSSSTNQVQWGIPLAWVAKHGDEVIYNEGGNPGSRNPEQDNYYYPGGRAYYASLAMPDGTYNIGVDLYASGVNNLTQCINIEYTVIGNLMDDFYVRQIMPEDPFPSEIFPTGPTIPWLNSVETLNRLADWVNFSEDTMNWPN